MNRIALFTLILILASCTNFNPGPTPEGWTIVEQTNDAVVYARTSQLTPDGDTIKADTYIYNRHGGAPGTLTLSKDSCNDSIGYIVADATGRTSPLTMAFKRGGTATIDKTADFLCKKFKGTP